MQQWIRYCRSRSNIIIVRLLEEAKSQAQPERGSCERSRGVVPWSTHILVRLLHETKSTISNLMNQGILRLEECISYFTKLP